MPAATPARRSVAGTISAIVRHYGHDDPRLPALRRKLDAIAIADIGEWAKRAAAALPPLSHEEIEAAADLIRKLDMRIAGVPVPPPAGAKRRAHGAAR